LILGKGFQKNSRKKFQNSNLMDQEVSKMLNEESENHFQSITISEKKRSEAGI